MGALAEQIEKEKTSVKPYTRAGRPVKGYDREKAERARLNRAQVRRTAANVLRVLGFRKGPLRQRLAQYQKEEGLPVTGEVDRETLLSMRDRIATRRKQNENRREHGLEPRPGPFPARGLKRQRGARRKQKPIDSPEEDALPKARTDALAAQGWDYHDGKWWPPGHPKNRKERGVAKALRWREDLHPRGPDGRFIARLGEALNYALAPPDPWLDRPSRQRRPSPRFRPAPKPRDDHEVWQQLPHREVVLREEIAARALGKDSVRLPEGTLVSRRNPKLYRVDGPTGVYYRKTLREAAQVAEQEEHNARAARFGNRIPGLYMDPLPGVDVPPEDPIGDKVGGMLHGGYVTLPHGTTVRRAPGDDAGGTEGDTFEVTSPGGVKLTFPAIDKAPVIEAAREFEDSASGRSGGGGDALPDDYTPSRKTGEGPLPQLPKEYPEERVTFHRVSEQILAYAQAPTNEVALVRTPGGFGTPKYGVERLSVRGTDVVRERDDRTVAKGSIPGVGDRTANALDAFFELADRLLRELGTAEGTTGQRFGGPIIWPEHFDIAVEQDAPNGLRANFGASPGDENYPEPYFYVGPWVQTVPGETWNGQGFNGAILTYAEIMEAPDQEKLIREFLRDRFQALAEGRDIQG